MMHLPQERWLFGDCGNRMSLGSHSLRQLLPSKTYDGDLIAALVKNMGFVGMTSRHGYHEINIRSEVVSQPAYNALLNWITDSRPRNIVIDEFTTSGVKYMCRSPQEAVAQLDRLTRKQNFDSRCSEVEVSPDECRKSGDVLAGLMDVWNLSSRGQLRRLVEYANANLGRRFAVVGMHDDFNRFLMIGSGMQVPLHNWHREALGKPVITQPDSEYWCWVNRRVTQSLGQMQPYASDMSVNIYWPASGLVSRQYRRLYLPCRLDDGSAVLFSASHSTPTVDRARNVG